MTLLKCTKAWTKAVLIALETFKFFICENFINYWWFCQLQTLEKQQTSMYIFKNSIKHWKEDLKIIAKPKLRYNLLKICIAISMAWISTTMAFLLFPFSTPLKTRRWIEKEWTIGNKWKSFALPTPLAFCAMCFYFHCDS